MNRPTRRSLAPPSAILAAAAAFLFPAAPAVARDGDAYAVAAAESGTTRFLEEVWAPASLTPAKGPSVMERHASARAAVAPPQAAREGTPQAGGADADAEVWMPASSETALASARGATPELGAASGEPDEAESPAEASQARDAHERWVMAIWNSP
jgi:hypothetical protein